MTKIPEPNLRIFKIALYSNTKHHELPTQKWRDFHGDLRTVVTASLNPMDGDVLVVMDDTEPLRELSKAEKESIVTFKKPTSSTYYRRCVTHSCKGTGPDIHTTPSTCSLP